MSSAGKFSPISKLPLVLISAGIEGDEKIVYDLLKASEIGKDQMKKFADKHIDTNSTSFSDPVKKKLAKHIQEHE